MLVISLSYLKNFSTQSRRERGGNTKTHCAFQSGRFERPDQIFHAEWNEVPRRGAEAQGNAIHLLYSLAAWSGLTCF